jgi:hypothetical protein
MVASTSAQNRHYPAECRDTHTFVDAHTHAAAQLDLNQPRSSRCSRLWWQSGLARYRLIRRARDPDWKKVHSRATSSSDLGDATPTVDKARADTVSRSNLLHPGTCHHGLRDHSRSKRSSVRPTPISHDLNPWYRRAISGCHGGSLILASQHATKQIDPWLSGQGGRRRRDTILRAILHDREIRL